MAERDRDQGPGSDPEERDAEHGAGTGPGGEPKSPLDEEAAWAAIVAGYGDEPPDPPGARPFRSVEDLALLDDAGDGGEAHDGKAEGRDRDRDSSAPDGADDGDGSGDRGPSPGAGLGSSVVFAPGVGGGGPRDYSLADPDARTGAGDDDDTDHFVPPEPPPLPAADATAKFAWLGLVGGPVLLLLAVLLGWDMTWWLSTLCVGGFIGGCASLVMRMRPDEDDDDPGRGAVV